MLCCPPDSRSRRSPVHSDVPNFCLPEAKLGHTLQVGVLIRRVSFDLETIAAIRTLAAQAGQHAGQRVGKQKEHPQPFVLPDMHLFMRPHARQFGAADAENQLSESDRHEWQSPPASTACQACRQGEFDRPPFPAQRTAGKQDQHAEQRTDCRARQSP